MTAVGQPAGNEQTAQIAVTLQYRELQVDVPIAIDMQQAGRRWRVVGVSGLSHALDIVNTAQAERRAIDNRSVAERVAATLEVGAPTVERKAHGRKQTTYLLRLPLTNHSADTVIGVMLALRTHASEAAPAMELEVQHPIAGGNDIAGGVAIRRVRIEAVRGRGHTRASRPAGRAGARCGDRFGGPGRHHLDRGAAYRRVVAAPGSTAMNRRACRNRAPKPTCGSPPTARGEG